MQKTLKTGKKLKTAENLRNLLKGNKNAGNERFDENIRKRKNMRNSQKKSGKRKKLRKKQKMRKTQTESCFKKCGKIGENKRTEEKLGKRE